MKIPGIANKNHILVRVRKVHRLAVTVLRVWIDRRAVVVCTRAAAGVTAISRLFAIAATGIVSTEDVSKLPASACDEVFDRESHRRRACGTANMCFM